MPAGFEAWGDHGYQQIDGNFRNLRLFDRGTIVCATPSPNGAGMFNGSITVNLNAPVLAWRCPNYCVPLTVRNGDGSYTYFFYCNGASNVEYFLYAPDTPVSPASNGMQVFNQAGQLVFDAGDKAMKVLDFYSPDFSSPGPVRSYGGRRVAVTINFIAQSVIYTPVSGGFLQLMSQIAAKTPGEDQVQNFNLQFVRRNVAGQTQPRTTASAPSSLVLDVTGL